MRQKNREVSNREELLEIMRRCDVCRLALNARLLFNVVGNTSKLTFCRPCDRMSNFPRFLIDNTFSIHLRSALPTY